MINNRDVYHFSNNLISNLIILDFFELNYATANINLNAMSVYHLFHFSKYCFLYFFQSIYHFSSYIFARYAFSLN